MFITHLIVGLFEFALSVAVSAAAIYVTYRLAVRANPDFDMADEILKGNAAVGTLVAAEVFAVSSIVLKAISSVVGIFRLHLLAPGSGDRPLWQLLAIGAGHIVMALALGLFSVSATLRLFGRLGRRMHFGKELQRGNMAVGILLAGVVVTVALYVGDGVGALSKALVPQPAIGRLRVLP